MSRNFKARIDENRKLHKTHNLLTISPLSPIPRFEPGQFLMIGLDRGCDPLLRRPFSVLRAGPNGHQILYRIRGKGTMILSALQEGSTVDVIGPVGNQYPLPAQGMTPLLVAGGIGIASLFSLAERLSQKAYIFYGARTGDEIFLLDDLMRMPRELHRRFDRRVR